MSVASSSVKDCRAKAGGFTGTGWVGARPLALQVRGRHGALLDREERLARLAVEDEHVPRLRGLGDGVHHAPPALHGHEHGRLRQVAVPQVVAHDLVVPDALSGGRLQGEHAVAEEVGAVAVAAPEVPRRRAGRQEDEPARVVHADPAPRVRAADGLPRVGGPGVVAGLARLRDRVERPPDRRRCARRRRGRAPGRRGPAPRGRACRGSAGRDRRRPASWRGRRGRRGRARAPRAGPRGRPFRSRPRASPSARRARTGTARRCRGRARPRPSRQYDDTAVHAERVRLGPGGEGVEAPQLTSGRGVEGEGLQTRPTSRRGRRRPRPGCTGSASGRPPARRRCGRSRPRGAAPRSRR